MTGPGGKGHAPRNGALSGRTKERYDLGWLIAFGTDEEREDAKARLEFMDAEDRAWKEAFDENPHLVGKQK